MNESDRHVEAVLSALSLLDCFSRDEGWRLEDFHGRTGLTRSRIIRLAGTLVHKGYLVHDRSSAQYRLGPSLFRLGSLLMERYGSMASGVRPVLRDLVSATGLTAMFSVVGGRERLILAKEEPDYAVRYTVQEGQARPIVLGASGRVLVAFSSNEIAHDLIEKSEFSEPEKKNFRHDLARIRAKGFDLSESELTRHAFAIATPVFSQADELLGVLTVAGPTLEYREEKLEELVALLKEKSSQVPLAKPIGSLAVAETLEHEH